VDAVLGRRSIGALIAVAVVGTVLVWEFGIKAHRAKSEAWEGVITDTYRTRRWWRGFRRWDKPAYRYYNYYWVVETDNGLSLPVEVPWHLWKQGESGNPVRKIRGERWPRLATPQAERDREVKQQVLDTILSDQPPPQPESP
jgi:hypothetical protein